MHQTLMMMWLMLSQATVLGHELNKGDPQNALCKFSDDDLLRWPRRV
jgi:hypothetical protein